VNQDFHGARVPTGTAAAHGAVVALADGISSSAVSQIASAAAVRSLLDDYYATPETWSTRRAGVRVLSAINAWLYAQNGRAGHRSEPDHGYVCTLSALICKGAAGHLFHVGDSRIYRVHRDALELLTRDHRLALGGGESYLARALGAAPDVEIDYQTFPVGAGEIFLLATDGVYEHIEHADIAGALAEAGDDYNAAARALTERALARGSTDNLTALLVRVDARDDDWTAAELRRDALPLPPALSPRMTFDGYTIIRELHASHRSHLHLAVDDASGARVALKTPSIDLSGDDAYLDRFLIEEWVARRVNHPNVLKPAPATRPRAYLYVAMEYLDGQTLAQWRLDHPDASVGEVRALVEQIAKGLQALHRLEILHQDLRPENVMIGSDGTVKLIDFASARVAGLADGSAASEPQPMLGTLQYTAPELFIGDDGSERSDQFSLAVITYELLTGRLPYGADVARVRHRGDLARLIYHSARDGRRGVPSWIDETLRRALQPDPAKRYESLSEFLQDLRRPNRRYLNRDQPLLVRDPVRFWKSLALLLAAVCAGLTLKLLSR